MGNCISKINKDHFLVFEGLMKNDILFSNRLTRLNLEWGTRKNKYQSSLCKKDSSKLGTWRNYKLGCDGETFKTS